MKLGSRSGDTESLCILLRSYAVYRQPSRSAREYVRFDLAVLSGPQLWSMKMYLRGKPRMKTRELGSRETVRNRCCASTLFWGNGSRQTTSNTLPHHPARS